LILSVLTVNTTKGWAYRCRYPFFGLTQEYKVYLHQQIFQLGYYSQGAINVDIAYDLPVYLRNFYYKQLTEIKEKESSEHNKSTSSSSKRVSKPY